MKATFDERGVMVQAGDLIARRFRLLRTDEYDIPGATRFVAHDTRLNREVTVDIISSVARTSVVRAAHRALTIRDRRLTRILAARSERRDDAPFTYVVSERPVGVTLDTLLGQAAFLPETAAAIVGEAAAILHVPLAAGIHHGMIRGRSLTVTPRGRIMVSGLGVEGELASQAGLVRGRTERADAIALARIFVTAVTAMDADEVTTDDLPEDLTSSARTVCEALLRGSGPLTLTQLTEALGTGDTALLSTLVAEAPMLRWPPPPQITDVADADLVDVVPDTLAELEDITAPADSGPARDVPEGAEEPDVGTEAVDGSSTRLLTRFGRAVDDIDEFRDIVAAQERDTSASVMEVILDRLHQRFPQSTRLTDLAAAAHVRAQSTAPFNVGPLLVTTLIVALFVVAVIGASMMSRPIDNPYDVYNNPSQTYPEFTIGQTPNPAPSQ